jgi:hypothetical protein
MVAYSYNRNGGTADDLVVMFVVENGRLLFFAPPSSPFSGKVANLNASAAKLDAEEAADYFDTYADRWNGQNMHTTVVSLDAREARKVEATKAKWRKS